MNATNELYRTACLRREGYRPTVRLVSARKGEVKPPKLTLLQMMLRASLGRSR